jgi:carbon-monoxide dehydrogenase small subunit
MLLSAVDVANSRRSLVVGERFEAAERRIDQPSSQPAGVPTEIEATVNGQPARLEVTSHDLLIDVIRDHLGLTGTKRSCEMSVCGSCTVLLDGEPYSSCMTLAIEAAGRALTTIEGVGHPGALSDVQRAFIEEGAIQCGFCTPGFVMACHALLDRNADASDADIAHTLDGNICRCTGYVAILRAARRVRDDRRSAASPEKS